MTPTPNWLFASPEFALAAVATVVATAALTAAGTWATFRKAGEPGWAAFVPIYNLVVLARVGHCARFWVWLAFVPGLNVVAGARLATGVADQFDRGLPFGLGLVVLPWLCWPLLGFGGSTYRRGFDDDDWTAAD